MTGLTVKTPWHLWVVGIVGLLWNAFGCVDFVMTNLQGDAWLRAMKMTEPQIAYFHAMPAWAHAVWAIGVWGGMLGALLLLLRRKWAFHVLLVSFLGFIGGLIYCYALSDAVEVMGKDLWIPQAMIGLGCVLQLWYAWAMMKRGVLR